MDSLNTITSLSIGSMPIAAMDKALEAFESSKRGTPLEPVVNQLVAELRAAVSRESTALTELHLNDTALTILSAFGWVVREMDVADLPADAREVARQVDERLLSRLGDNDAIIDSIFRSVRRLLAESAPAPTLAAEKAMDHE